MQTPDAELEVIQIYIERNRRGLYMATSPDLSGLFVSHRDLNKIIADMPNIVRIWFRRRHGLDVRVFQETVKQETGAVNITALAMPAGVANYSGHALI